MPRSWSDRLEPLRAPMDRQSARLRPHGCPPFLGKCVNDVVSITYTAGTKGATNFGIFPVENGPIEMLVGDRKNIRAGL